MLTIAQPQRRGPRLPAHPLRPVCPQSPSRLASVQRSHRHFRTSALMTGRPSGASSYHGSRTTASRRSSSRRTLSSSRASSRAPKSSVRLLRTLHLGARHLARPRALRSLRSRALRNPRPNLPMRLRLIRVEAPSLLAWSHLTTITATNGALLEVSSIVIPWTTAPILIK